jgi:peptide/nickel transport system permease protein
MKIKLKNLNQHKTEVILLLLFLIIVFLNSSKFINSFVSLYYTIALFFSDFNLGQKYFYNDLIEYWIGALFILLIVIFLSIKIIKGVIKNPYESTESFYKNIFNKVKSNPAARLCIILLCILISVGFLCPYISPYNPYEISNVSVSRYIKPFGTVKYFISKEFNFNLEDFRKPETSSEKLAYKLKNLRDEMLPKTEKIYFDSLTLIDSKLILFQGKVKKEIIPGEIGRLQGDIHTQFYLLGSDGFGRDVFSRIIYGTRVSLSIALISLFLSMFIGIFIGLISGYTGGIIDSFLMRFVDLVLAFPTIFLIFLVIGLFGNSIFLIILFLGTTTWMDIARLVRSQVLSVKNENYVLSAKALGFSRWRIVLRHILPNVLTPVLINAAFRVANIILAESALSFIGIGVRPPIASWGNIINEGKDSISYAWWISAFPGIIITLTVISFNLIGDKLREVINRD